MLDMVRESSDPCSDLVWMCEREGFAFSKPQMVGEKEIDGLALFDVYDPIHGLSVAYMDDPGLAGVGDIQEENRGRVGAGEGEPVPIPVVVDSKRTSKSSLRTKTPCTPCLRLVPVSRFFPPLVRVRRPRRL